MDIILPVLIGIGLSMDCFAVSLALGTSTENKILDTAVIIAFCFGIFQVGMILLGWTAGTWLIVFIAGFDHWLAFLLLAVIGVKMIIEGFKPENEEEPIHTLSSFGDCDILCDKYRCTWGGISFGFLHSDILIPASLSVSWLIFSLLA
jgi:putative Mn2+ efflux pump MntP